MHVLLSVGVISAYYGEVTELETSSIQFADRRMHDQNSRSFRSHFFVSSCADVRKIPPIMGDTAHGGVPWCPEFQKHRNGTPRGAPQRMLL